MSNKEFHIDRWPPGIESGIFYEVPCDDRGRGGGVWLRVFISPADGDVYVSMLDWEDIKEEEGTKPDPFPSIRIRTYAGGGRHYRTRQALLNLAEAIMLDNEEISK